jgi:hypothetical protein
VGRLTALFLAKKKPYTWGDSEEKAPIIVDKGSRQHQPKPMTVNLKAIHLVNEGSYLVTRDYHSLEVDGVPVSANTFVVSDPLSIKSVRKIPGVISHYVDEQGEIKSVESYTSEKSSLLVGATEDSEYSDCYSFSDLDQEFSYRRFLKTWTPVYTEDKFDRESVTLELTEVRTNSGDPDIRSLWNAPGMVSKAHLYSLDRLAISVREFKAYCETHGLTYTLGGATSSGIRFAQIDGIYLGFNDMDYSRAYAFIGTLEQCKQEKERIQKRVETEVKLFIAKHRTKPNLKNAGEVLSDLDDIYRAVSGISPVKTSRSAYTSALGKIAALREEVRQELLA